MLRREFDDTVWGCDSQGWWELQGLTDYKYDSLDRLIESKVTYDEDGGGPLKAITQYVYDDVGNTEQEK